MTTEFNPIIFIDGPDCVGKTTLAKLICERINAAYMHFGAPGTDIPSGDHLTHFKNCTRDLIEKSKDSIIVVDRFFLSAIVHETLRGAKYQDLLNIFKHFKLYFNYSSNLHIYCLPSTESTNTFINSHEPIYDISKINKLFEVSSIFITDTQIQTLTYNRASHPIPKLSDWLYESFNMLKEPLRSELSSRLLRT